MGTRLRLGLLLVALMGWPAVAGAQGQSATVLSIGDGDTIRVRLAGKAITVRLACIDAPELAQSPWGQQARAQLGVWSTPGGITRPWDFRRSRRSASVPDDATPGGRGYRWSEIGSYVRAQQLLGHGHIDLDGDGDGKACESLR